MFGDRNRTPKMQGLTPRSPDFWTKFCSSFITRRVLVWLKFSLLSITAMDAQSHKSTLLFKAAGGRGGEGGSRACKKIRFAANWLRKKKLGSAEKWVAVLLVISCDLVREVSHASLTPTFLLVANVRLWKLLDLEPELEDKRLAYHN